jgi:hypothetical protein
MASGDVNLGATTRLLIINVGGGFPRGKARHAEGSHDGLMVTRHSGGYAGIGRPTGVMLGVLLQEQRTQQKVPRLAVEFFAVGHRGRRRLFRRDLELPLQDAAQQALGSE